MKKKRVNHNHHHSLRKREGDTQEMILSKIIGIQIQQCLCICEIETKVKKVSFVKNSVISCVEKQETSLCVSLCDPESREKNNQRMMIQESQEEVHFLSRGTNSRLLTKEIRI